jgi:hypothetical protein
MCPSDTGKLGLRTLSPITKNSTSVPTPSLNAVTSFSLNVSMLPSASSFGFTPISFFGCGVCVAFSGDGAAGGGIEVADIAFDEDRGRGWRSEEPLR